MSDDMLRRVFEVSDDPSQAWNPGRPRQVQAERRRLLRGLGDLLPEELVNEAELADVWVECDRTLFLEVGVWEPGLRDPNVLLSIMRLLATSHDRWRILFAGGDRDRSMVVCADGWATARSVGRVGDGPEKLQRAIQDLAKASGDLEEEVRRLEARSEAIVKERLDRLLRTRRELSPDTLWHVVTIFYEQGQPDWRLCGMDEFTGESAPWSCWLLLAGTDLDALDAALYETFSCRECVPCDDEDAPSGPENLCWEDGSYELEKIGLVRSDGEIEYCDTSEQDALGQGKGLLFSVIASDRARSVEATWRGQTVRVTLSKDEAVVL